MDKQTPISVFWFRRDLRLNDNAGLYHALKSGMPVNNISFYDEINWNLMNLGFPAVNEIDIKNAILTILGE